MLRDDNVLAILSRKGTRIWDVTPETTVYEALQLMAEKDIGALLVIAGTELRGVFSERDYARKVVLVGETSKRMRVTEAMTSPPIVGSLSLNVDACLRLMNKYRIRHLPIVDHGVVVGVVSIGDLVSFVVSRQKEEIEELSQLIMTAGSGTS